MQPYVSIIVPVLDRAALIGRLLDSLLAQTGVDLDVVVVGNGYEPAGLPERVQVVSLPENVGIPEGRNVGAAHVSGDLVFFFDDDAYLPTTDVLARLAEVLRRDRRVAAVQPRPQDPTGKPAPRRWVPRLRSAWSGS